MFFSFFVLLLFPKVFFKAVFFCLLCFSLSKIMNSQELATPAKRYDNYRQMDRLGVQYFYHFPKDIMKPYGVATDARSTFSNKLKRINHEFFHRPRMALSMMAQTILKNKERVIDKSTSLIDAFLGYHDWHPLTALISCSRSIHCLISVGSIQPSQWHGSLTSAIFGNCADQNYPARPGHLKTV